MPPNPFLTPLTDVKITKHLIPAYNLIPNTSIQNKPLLLYHHAFRPSITASQIESHLRAVGVVEPAWRYTMYTTSHFHSTTHEVLCIASGRARLCFGGEGNEGRVEVLVGCGDVVVVPAGVAHCLVEERNGMEEGGRFGMVGSYPVGAREWDMCYGREGEEETVRRIGGLGWFERDPVFGDGGPVCEV